MTAAEKLRRAAEVLRERAEAATPGPWVAAELYGGVRGAGDRNCVADTTSSQHGHDDASFIATFDPTIALAVADWLDDIAGQQEHCEWIVRTYAKYPDVRWPSTTRAIAVADAILAGVEG